MKTNDQGERATGFVTNGAVLGLLGLPDDLLADATRLAQGSGHREAAHELERRNSLVDLALVQREYHRAHVPSGHRHQARREEGLRYVAKKLQHISAPL